jgi:hypothetical protein
MQAQGTLIRYNTTSNPSPATSSSQSEGSDTGIALVVSS